MVKKVVAITLILTVLAFGTTLYATSTLTPRTEPTVAKQPVVKLDKYHTGAPDPQELLELVNKERAKAGVAPLTIDTRLNQSAQRKADDMTKYKYFGHVSPHDGKHGYEYINDVDIRCITNGENLLASKDSYTSYDSVYTWMHSKPHREAMLRSTYNTVGFGMSGNKVAMHYCQQ